ncbi:MAG: BspA family leucine-rich repeat surface protein, partial [Actinobacteria bacterium]|nr:BspA family leucine-rich repeat surface protein [Actinomycetota bacterium]
MMFAVGVCDLPETGGSTFVLVAALFMLVAGVIVLRWVRQSDGRMSVVVAPLVLLSGLVLAPSVTDPCAPQTTTVAPTTTVVPVDPNLVLEIDTTVLGPVPAPKDLDSVSATDESFVYELGLFGGVDVHVDWGDGSFDDVSVAGPFRHTYTTSGKYTITVSGSLTGFGQDPLNADLLSGAHYLTAVRSFGELGITSLALAFYGSMNLTDVPSSLPAGVTNFFGMFGDASSFNGDVSGWDTGSVTNMSAMFGDASSFNGDVSGWDTGSVTDMSAMFYLASSFNGDVSGWDTSLVTNMRFMFYGASSFNGDVSGWDTSSATDMSAMFYGASPFNGDVSGWDTSSATNMSAMFGEASSFNGDVSGWDTGSATDMSAMFYEASSFSGDVSGWDTGSATDMRRMFYEAALFNQSLGAWDISAVINMSNMLDQTALSVDNYDATLIGWA